MSQASSGCPGRRGRSTSADATGTSVSASTSDAARHATTAAARGWYIRPSMPDIAKSGRKTATTISVANAMGRPTSIAARRAGFPSPHGAGFQAVEDVLGDDDRGVHQQPDGDREAAERHGVDPDVRPLEEEP